MRRRKSAAPLGLTCASLPHPRRDRGTQINGGQKHSTSLVFRAANTARTTSISPCCRITFTSHPVPAAKRGQTFAQNRNMLQLRPQLRPRQVQLQEYGLLRSGTQGNMLMGIGAACTTNSGENWGCPPQKYFSRSVHAVTSQMTVWSIN